MGRQSGHSSGQRAAEVQGDDDECEGALSGARALRAELRQGLPQARAARLALLREAGAVAVRLQKAPPSLEAAHTLETARSQVAYRAHHKFYLQASHTCMIARSHPPIV